MVKEREVMGTYARPVAVVHISLLQLCLKALHIISEVALFRVDLLRRRMVWYPAGMCLTTQQSCRRTRPISKRRAIRMLCHPEGERRCRAQEGSARYAAMKQGYFTWF